MDKFSKDFGNLGSQDDFDLLSLGFSLGEEEPAGEEADDEPKINPLHDMDSLEFLLWVEEEAQREIARRKAEAQKEESAQPPKP